MDILSSIVNVSSLQDINTLEALSQNEATVIELLNHYSKLSGDSPKTSQAAREIVVACRQAQMNSKSSKTELPGAGAFDRLIYLLDRYLDYCRSIHLSAWPIDHLKVSIWIKNDVTLTTNSTRMKPLRKTVRCYVTSLESIRIKTLHLFKGFHLAIHLMKSKIILEILNSLSVERDNLEERLGGNQALVGELYDTKTFTERDLLLNQIRSTSGDECGKVAMDIVKASRGGESNHSGCKPRGKTADPHIHTLLRYRNYCFLNRIPMWPIDAARVALWLKESVLISDPRSKNKKSIVSFRTVQVYLSRLEYARLKTEHLFQKFPSYGVSLYKSEEIMDILNRLNTFQKPEHEDIDTEDGPRPEPFRLDSHSMTLPITEFRSAHTATDPLPKHAGLSSLLPTPSSPHCNHSVKRKLSVARNFSPRKASRVDIENLRESTPTGDGETVSPGPRLALRNSNGRRIPSLHQEKNCRKLSARLYTPSVTCAPPPHHHRIIPPISEWFSSTPSSAKTTKGCISFILCSDEESELSYSTTSTSNHSYELRTPPGSPTRGPGEHRKYVHMSPSRLLESPACHRFWSQSLSELPCPFANLS